MSESLNDYSVQRIKTKPNQSEVHKDKGDIVACPKEEASYVYTHGTNGCINCQELEREAPYEAGYIHCKLQGKKNMEQLLAETRKRLKNLPESKAS